MIKLQGEKAKITVSSEELVVDIEASMARKTQYFNC